MFVCAILFVALSGMENPARPAGRILSIEAGARALEVARSRGLRGYEVVHVARARPGEGGDVDRWVVLVDRAPRMALAEAWVVELRASDGQVLRVRRPRDR